MATFTAIIPDTLTHFSTRYQSAYVHGCQTWLKVPPTAVKHSTEETLFGWCGVEFGGQRMSVGWIQNGRRGANGFLFTYDTRQGDAHNKHLHPNGAEIQAPATTWLGVSLVYNPTLGQWEAWYSLGYLQTNNWQLIHRFPPTFAQAQFVNQGVSGWHYPSRPFPLAGAIHLNSSLCYGVAGCGGPGTVWRIWDTTIPGGTSYTQTWPYVMECTTLYWACHSYKR
jgi:hypothetical protein